MGIPITNPHLSANLEDNSKVDDSFAQQGTTVNLGTGATYNQNCGNQREMSRAFSTWLGILFSVVCDIAIIVFLLVSFDHIQDRLEAFDRDAACNHQKIERQSQEYMKQAKEGTIWLLRDDIIKTIDYHEATKTITQKQYRRLKDEYEYYSSIGGNHDVKDRFDDFVAEIFGTQTIKMVVSDIASMTKVER